MAITTTTRVKFWTAADYRAQQLSSTYDLKMVISGIDTESLVDDPDSDPDPDVHLNLAQLWCVARC